MFFSKPGYIALGDPYVPHSIKENGRTIVKDGFKKGGHDYNFKPAKTCFERVPRNLSYAYMEQGGAAKKNYKDEEGAVITGPRNFTTQNPKKGRVGKNTTFSGMIPYKEDDWDKNRKTLLK